MQDNSLPTGSLKQEKASDEDPKKSPNDALMSMLKIAIKATGDKTLAKSMLEIHKAYDRFLDRLQNAVGIDLDLLERDVFSREESVLKLRKIIGQENDLAVEFSKANLRLGKAARAISAYLQEKRDQQLYSEVQDLARQARQTGREVVLDPDDFLPKPNALQGVEEEIDKIYHQTVVNQATTESGDLLKYRAMRAKQHLIFWSYWIVLILVVTSIFTTGVADLLEWMFNANLTGHYLFAIPVAAMGILVERKLVRPYLDKRRRDGLLGVINQLWKSEAVAICTRPLKLMELNQCEAAFTQMRNELFRVASEPTSDL